MGVGAVVEMMGREIEGRVVYEGIDSLM